MKPLHTDEKKTLTVLVFAMELNRTKAERNYKIEYWLRVVKDFFSSNIIFNIAAAFFAI